MKSFMFCFIDKENVDKPIRELLTLIFSSIQNMKDSLRERFSKLNLVGFDGNEKMNYIEVIMNNLICILKM